jgi:NAD(P)H-hydrate epimerase
MDRNVIVVLKGYRTIIGFPDGRAWINPTGSPALATGGTGDVLTGMIAAMLAQYPKEPELAIGAAVYLHGRSGQLGAEEIGERPFLATDIFSYLPKALHECANVPDRL